MSETKRDFMINGAILAVIGTIAAGVFAQGELFRIAGACMAVALVAALVSLVLALEPGS